MCTAPQNIYVPAGGIATKDGRASGTTATWRLEGQELRPLLWNREEWGSGGVGFRLRGGEGGR